MSEKSETVKEYNNPFQYTKKTKVADSLLVGDELIKQKHSEKSGLAVQKEEDKTLNKIDLIVQHSADKENTHDKTIVEN